MPGEIISERRATSNRNGGRHHRGVAGDFSWSPQSSLVVTPEGLPLAYEVLPGNTSDKTTLRGFLERIERQYGKARRVWLMDRGVPTEEVLAEMRVADPPVLYLVGTPKGRLTRLQKHLSRLDLPSASSAFTLRFITPLICNATSSPDRHCGSSEQKRPLSGEVPSQRHDAWWFQLLLHVRTKLP
jgi:hypothetical protein